MRNKSCACLVLAAATAMPAFGVRADEIEEQAPTTYAWIGTIKLVSSSRGCAGKDVITAFKDKPPLGSFRPKINSGEDKSALSFFFDRAGGIFQTTSSSSQMNGRGNYTGVFIRAKVDYDTMKGAYDFTLNPSSVLSSTPTVVLKGTVSNFWGTPGCTIEIQSTMKKKPL